MHAMNNYDNISTSITMFILPIVDLASVEGDGVFLIFCDIDVPLHLNTSPCLDIVCDLKPLIKGTHPRSEFFYYIL